jgi:hypothetical protein
MPRQDGASAGRKMTNRAAQARSRERKADIQRMLTAIAACLLGDNPDTGYAQRVAAELKDEMLYDIFQGGSRRRRASGGAPSVSCSKCAVLQERIQELKDMHANVLRTVAHNATITTPPPPQIIFRQFKPIESKVPSGAGGSVTDDDDDDHHTILDLDFDHATFGDNIDDVLQQNADTDFDIYPVMDLLVKNVAQPSPPPRLLRFVALITNYTA